MLTNSEEKRVHIERMYERTKQSSYISRSQLADYLNYKNVCSVRKYVKGTKKKGSTYLIDDVAENIVKLTDRC